MDELYKNLVKLKPKDNVPFKCIGCGECCKHVKEQVPVETLDAFRITRYLMEQMRVSLVWMTSGKGILSRRF